jgi:hypothetical protein
LQSADGVFYLLSKADLKTIDRAANAMMPSDYASRLSLGQLNDVASYLLNLGRSLAPAVTQHVDDE